MISNKNLANFVLSLAAERCFVEVVIVDRFKFCLESAEVEGVDDAFEKFLPHSGLSRRRPAQVQGEEFLSQNGLDGMLRWRVQDHLAPFVDRKTVGVDLRDFQPLTDDFKGLLERRIVALNGQFGDEGSPNGGIF